MVIILLLSALGLIQPLSVSAADSLDQDAFLDMVQEATFRYFWEEANPENGLVRDRSTATSPSSIAATGFGLSALTVGVDHGWITRAQAGDRVLAALRFFWNAEQSTDPGATGYRGFFYHFLDMETGRRVWESELSTIDTALLLAGILHAGAYFDTADPVEEEIRALADSIYRRVDFRWMQYRGGSPAVSHGWRPESGFIPYDWIGYSEAMILYILGLGSPTHALDAQAWQAWVSGYDGQWRSEYGFTYLTFPPLFGHQYSHVWIDFRGIQDAYMRGKGIDYFENSRRATLAQQAYHIANPYGHSNYGRYEWGLTASDTPFGYLARGAPPTLNDEGTLAPTAPGGSVPFAPDPAIATLRAMYETYGDRLWGPYGFRDAYNADIDWFGDDYLGIDQGPILLMIENYRTEAVWSITMGLPSVQNGLLAAGFTGTGLPTDEPAAGARHSLNVFPNPASERLDVEYETDAPGPVRVYVVDVVGRRVVRLAVGYRPAGAWTVRADLSSLPNGAYFILVETASGRLSRSIIVSR